MSAVIETRTRGDFHVQDDVRAARAALRESAGLATVFLTEQCGRPVTITYQEVRRVRKPGEPSRARRRIRGCLLALTAMVLTIVGTIGVCLGGSALIATVFGHADNITTPWYAAIPGFAAWYAGGWLGHQSCELLGIE